MLRSCSARIALLGRTRAGQHGVPLLGPVPYKHQLAMLIDKRVMLDATPSPRVILVGGSNLMFGVDSARSGAIARGHRS